MFGAPLTTVRSLCSAGNEIFSTPLTDFLNLNVTAHTGLLCVVNSPFISPKACMGVYRRVLTCKYSITYLSLLAPVDGEIQPGYKNGRKRGQNPLESVRKGIKKRAVKHAVLMDCDGL